MISQKSRGMLSNKINPLKCRISAFLLIIISDIQWRYIEQANLKKNLSFKFFYTWICPQLFLDSKSYQHWDFVLKRSFMHLHLFCTDLFCIFFRTLCLRWISFEIEDFRVLMTSIKNCWASVNLSCHSNLVKSIRFLECVCLCRQDICKSGFTFQIFRLLEKSLKMCCEIHWNFSDWLTGVYLDLFSTNEFIKSPNIILQNGLSIQFISRVLIFSGVDLVTWLWA